MSFDSEASGPATGAYKVVLVADPYDAGDAAFVLTDVIGTLTTLFPWTGDLPEPKNRVEVRRHDSDEVVASIAFERRKARAERALKKAQRDLGRLTAQQFRVRYAFIDDQT